MVDWMNLLRSSTRPDPYKKRTLDDDDYESFFSAADARPRRTTPRSPQTRADIIAALEKKNSYRMWRLNHDYKWLRRQMKKMGHDPDDARELL